MKNLDLVGLADLKALRSRARALRAQLLSDLTPFVNAGDGVSFRRLPTSASDPGKLSVATTCTALMACAQGRAMEHLYGPDRTKLDPLVSRILADSWDSSGLPSDNAFTSVLVIRALGVLKRYGWVAPDIADKLLEPHAGDLHAGRTISEVAIYLAAGAPDSLSVTNYPARTEIAYWLLHGAAELAIVLGNPELLPVARWAERELMRQVTFVAAGSHAKVDPISLAMSACVLRRIERIVETTPVAGTIGEIEYLDAPELEHAILTFFAYQRDSLLWDSYFPMFHYPDAESGANHCWAFEVLEAVLEEFPALLTRRAVLTGLSKALEWCESHRLRYSANGVVYLGWNAGGQELTLRRGMPEAWAVAVVHIWLGRLVDACDRSIEQLIVREYSGSHLEVGHPDSRLWETLLDSPLTISGEAASLKETIEARILAPALGASAPTRPAKSALLFGPPGTAKTTIVRAVALRLGWPLIELSPSDFLDDGLERIYQRAGELFDDLTELSDVVILFDEIDALVQKRGFGDTTPRLDATRQFLTTSMLPRLGRLRASGRSIFFLATNHRQDFDEAITRAGRFDLLLHVAPPSWDAKRTQLDRFAGPGVDSNGVRACLEGAFEGEEELLAVLERSTFAEMRGFLDELAAGEDLLTQLKALEGVGIRTRAKLWARQYLGLREKLANGSPNPLYDEFVADRDASRIQV